ncbi:MAG: B12-binding domain-containing radical SAM protein [Candidatus Rifleibacteriota bacterium]
MSRLKIALIKPSMGEQHGRPYRTPAVLEPMFAALIAGQTSDDFDLVFFDERIEEIDFSQKWDLVAISVETFTALRSYQIASRFRQSNCPVLLGGFHPSLVPEEAALHADSVAIGTVETIWPEVLTDLGSGGLKKIYRGGNFGFANTRVDRSIFSGKKYLPVALVETSRGCRFSCNFCTVRSFYGNNVCFRDIESVKEEIVSLNRRFVFFTDDNIVAAPDQSIQLFQAIKPLKLKWASQASITSARDPKFLDLMAESGCFAVIIGLESIRSASLEKMGKSWAPAAGEVEKLLEEYRSRGIMVYGTFVFGYPGDTPQLIADTVDFAIDRRLFMANFNMLYPFPGTAVYSQLMEQRRLIEPRWWLSRSSIWDFPAFIPENMSPEQLSVAVKEARRRFGSISSLVRRSFDLKANFKNPFNSLIHLATNIVSRLDIQKKSGLRPGFNIPANQEQHQ